MAAVEREGLREEFLEVEDGVSMDRRVGKEMATGEKVSDRVLEGEDEPISWCEDGGDEDDNRVALGLVGKVWTERTINPSAFIATMKSIWRVKDGVDISHIGRNVFQFQFYHWKDKERVLAGQPWHFDRNAIILSNLDHVTKPSELVFFHMPIWARFYDIPFKGRMNEANARMMGDKIGQFIDMENEDYSGLEKSMRVRVMIDVRNPLKTYVNLRMREGEVCKVQVRYENLPNICFNCGRLGHGLRDCVESVVDSKMLRYGVWLRASPWRTVKDFDREGQEGMGVKCSIAKKLFVTKESEMKRKEAVEAVEDVASLLNKVSFVERLDENLEQREEPDRVVEEGDEASVIQGAPVMSSVELVSQDFSRVDEFIFGGTESLHNPVEKLKVRRCKWNKVDRGLNKGEGGSTGETIVG